MKGYTTLLDKLGEFNNQFLIPEYTNIQCSLPFNCLACFDILSRRLSQGATSRATGNISPPARPRGTLTYQAGGRTGSHKRSLMCIPRSYSLSLLDRNALSEGLLRGIFLNDCLQLRYCFNIFFAPSCSVLCNILPQYFREIFTSIHTGSPVNDSNQKKT